MAQNNSVREETHKVGADQLIVLKGGSGRRSSSCTKSWDIRAG